MPVTCLRASWPADEALALLVPAELADALLKRLRLYILRAKAQATLLDLPLAGLIGTPAEAGESRTVRLHGHDGRHLVLGAGAAAGAIPGPRSDWQLADIRAGLPAIVAATTGEFVPQMVNLDLLGGISFTKGCYTGQEIVARMKYLGRVKRRMLRFGTARRPASARRGAVCQPRTRGAGRHARRRRNPAANSWPWSCWTTCQGPSSSTRRERSPPAAWTCPTTFPL